MKFEFDEDVAKQGSEDNRNEVYRAYLFTLFGTLLIILISFVTYWLPMYMNSNTALSMIQTSKTKGLKLALNLVNVS